MNIISNIELTAEEEEEIFKRSHIPNDSQGGTKVQDREYLINYINKLIGDAFSHGKAIKVIVD